MGCSESRQIDRDAMKVMTLVRTGEDECKQDQVIGDNLEQYARIRLTSRHEAFDDIVNNWKVFRTVLPRQNVNSLKATLRTYDQSADCAEEVLPSLKAATSEINVKLRMSSNSSSIPSKK